MSINSNGIIMNEKLTNSEYRGGGTKQEYKGIDIVKFIMAIFVVAIHTHLYSSSNPIIETIYELVINCAVPYFFITSGFFRYREENQEKKLLDNLKKIIKLYLLWNIIYLPISIYGYVIGGYSIVKAILSYTRALLFIGDHFFSWPFWYLLGLIYAIIFVVLLKKLKLNDKKIFIITLITYIFSHTMIYLTLKCSSNHLVHLFNLFFDNGRVFSGIFLFTAGITIAKYKNKIKIPKKILLLFIALSCTVSIICPNELSKVILYVSIFLLALQFNNIRINTIYFRKCSTIFYFLHMINLFIFMLIVGIGNTYGVYSFILNIVICFIESFIIIIFQNKYKLKLLKELFNF